MAISPNGHFTHLAPRAVAGFDRTWEPRAALSRRFTNPMVVTISDIMGDESNDSTNDSSAGDDSPELDHLREACEALGADYDHASDYVDVHGKKDDLVEFARALEGNDELFALHEAYRRMNDTHRIILNWLRNDSRDYTKFTGAFYGDSDDPEPETYNYVQQQVRAEDNGNLIFYRALFPSPKEEYWDSEPACWHEFDALRYDTDSDNQVDSHIYVSSDWADEYGSFTIEVDGEQRPRPPANDEIGDFTTDGGSSDDSGSDVATRDAPFDPAEFTISELEDELEAIDYSADQLRAALNMEKGGKQRKGAKNALRDELDAVEAAQSDSDDSDDAEQSELSDAGKAGQVNSGPGDVPPDVVAELLDGGMTQERIMEIGPAKIEKLLDGGFDAQGIIDFYA